MNTDQNLAALRSLLTALGPLAVTFGLLKADQLGPIIETIMTLAGAAATIAGVGLSWWAHSHDAQIAAAARSIKAQPSVETAAPVIVALKDAGAVVNPSQMATKAELAQA